MSDKMPEPLCEIAPIRNRFTEQLGIAYPIICGAMYPCSNPGLVAAVSAAGGIGIIQPISFEYVYKTELRAGIREIRSLTDRPFGMNVLVERNIRAYEVRMERWVDIALEEGCRFFVTALGNPRWVIEKVKSVGGLVYHDVTERRFAEKALESGASGLICVNSSAGGHAGRFSAAELFEQLSGFGVPLICAGGIGEPSEFTAALKGGYAGVQMGTRFIASKECLAHSDYKQAIVNASAGDIVLTERVTGIPLSVIKTPYVEAVGTALGPISRALFRWDRTKGAIRAWYNLRGLRSIGKASLRSNSTKDYYQAGKSVAGIESELSVAEIVRNFVDYYQKSAN